MGLTCQGLEQVTQRQGSHRALRTQGLLWEQNLTSGNWQSHPRVSWFFSLLKALGNYPSDPLVSRLNSSWRLAVWAVILGFVSCLEFIVTYFIFKKIFFKD